MTNYTPIFDCWNSQRGLKHHRKITPDIKGAIDENLKEGWEIEDMVVAIKNFASCLASKETTWTYRKWSLAQFLTRGKKDNDKRWVWFSENNYRIDEWLSDAAIAKKIDKKRWEDLESKRLTEIDTSKTFREVPERVDINTVRNKIRKEWKVS